MQSLESREVLIGGIMIVLQAASDKYRTIASHECKKSYYHNMDLREMLQNAVFCSEL